MASRRPSYQVVTGVVVVLAVLGSITTLLHPDLPPPKLHEDYSGKGGYFAQAAEQSIDWVSLSDSTFREAAALNRPLLLDVGAEWDRAGRAVDRSMFGDREVANLVSSDYIPVRVDIAEDPEWENAFFPLSRFEQGLSPTFQPYFLNPQGRLYGLIPTYEMQSSDTAALVHALIASKKPPLRTEGVEFSQQQLLDLNDIMAPHSQVLPNFATEIDKTEQAGDPLRGGFPSDGVIHPLAEPFRFEIFAGRIDAAAKPMDSLLQGPLVDWLDGGFFESCDQNGGDLDFDKVASINAEMMSVVALYGALTHNPFAARVAHDTFQALTLRLTGSNGLLRTCRIADEVPSGRSRRSSFRPEDFRAVFNSGILPEAERRWAVSNLRIGRSSYTISVPNPAVIATPEFDKVLQDLRNAKRGVTPRFSATNYADVNGYACARLLECARLWGDGPALQSALALYRRLALFRKGDQVRHDLLERGNGPKLTDYLAVSDADLQAYLATGQVEYLTRGLNVLLSAKKLFELELVPGAWLMAKGSPLDLPKDYLCPELADNVVESCTAREIRLMDAYGCLLADNPAYGTQAKALSAGVAAAISQFATSSSRLGIHAAGYYTACLQAFDPVWAIAVGPDAVDVASSLYRLAPTRIIAPAVGPVRPDLQTKTPGIYLIEGGRVRGPMTVAEASAALSR